MTQQIPLGHSILLPRGENLVITTFGINIVECRPYRLQGEPSPIRVVSPLPQGGSMLTIDLASIYGRYIVIGSAQDPLVSTAYMQLDHPAGSWRITFDNVLDSQIHHSTTIALAGNPAGVAVTNVTRAYPVSGQLLTDYPPLH